MLLRVPSVVGLLRQKRLLGEIALAHEEAPWSVSRGFLRVFLVFSCFPPGVSLLVSRVFAVFSQCFSDFSRVCEHMMLF